MRNLYRWQYRSHYRWLSVAGLLLAATAALGQAPAQSRGPGNAAWAGLYAEYCAVCHGTDLTGEAQGTPLVGST